MNYREIIKPEKILEYIRLQKKFFRELANVNSDIYFMEKVYDFPFKTLGIPYQMVYYQFIIDNIFQYLIVKLHRIVNDNTKGVLTFLNFKNKVVNEFVYEKYKDAIISELRGIKFNDTVTKKIRDFRHAYFAHKNLNFFNEQSSEMDIEFKEVQEYVFTLNEIFKILTFEVEDQYEHIDYYNPDVRYVVENSFKEIFDDCLLSLLCNSDLFIDDDKDFYMDDLKEKELQIINLFTQKIKSLNFG